MLQAEPHDLLLECLWNGEYETGAALFGELCQPTPEDQRWYGLCLMGLGQLFEAKVALSCAQRRGTAAGIELATLYRLSGELELAGQLLAGVQTASLPDRDTVLYLHEAAQQAHAAGELRQARLQLEEAWRLGQAHWAGSALLVPVARLLATILSELGHAGQADRLFGYALDHARGGQLALVQGAWRGRCWSRAASGRPRNCCAAP